MKITEQDIFNFVFYPEKLEADKFKFISSNRDKHQEIISFCESLQTANNANLEGVADSINKNINRKSTNIIQLNKVEPKAKKDDYFIAADSPQLQPQIKTDTFIDESKTYFAKAIYYEENIKIFLFENENNVLENIELSLLPSEKVYQLESNHAPIIIENRESIDSIKITLQTD